MALGRRNEEQQAEMWVATQELPATVPCGVGNATIPGKEPNLGRQERVFP